MTERILRVEMVRNLTGLSRSTIARLEATGDFPARRKIGRKSIGWLESEVIAWVKQLAYRKLDELKSWTLGGQDHET